MYITNPKINEYIKSMMPNRDPVLLEMEQFAREHHFPIIGPMCGTFLRQLAIATSAERIFEMGSGFGYSACWFAGGIKDGGKIICTDGSAKNKSTAEEFLKRAAVDHLVEFYTGYAQDIIKRFDGPFDIILNDVDKEQYPEVIELVLPRLRKGGIFISDNVLWDGEILNDNPSEETRGIIEFNRRLFACEDLLVSIIPLRDGLGMAIKL